jgi:cell division septation protein DedD
MTEPGLRDLDQIQEEDEPSMPRSVTVTLVVLGGACVVFAGLALGGRTSRPQGAKIDPLGDLVAQHPSAGAKESNAKSLDLQPADVTFPQMLSDQGRPTTALAAVRSTAALPDVPANPPPPVASAPLQPPPPGDRLPVVPLPAEAVLEATPIVTRPRDPLTKAASDAAQITSPVSETVPSGHEGGYQLQVSSFRAQADAESFARQLRARGHKAYVVEAHVPGRGTWFRVRVGPFTTQRSAAQYRVAFESKEHVVPFIVTPDPGDNAR